jgi:hypothetical protein
MRSNLLFALMITSTAALMACSDKPEPEVPDGSGYGASYGAPAPVDTANQGAGGAAPTTTASSNKATIIAPAAAAVASPVLKGLAQKETSGMTEDGPAFAGQFLQGQVLEQSIQIQPGRCYTVVGLGVGITELDLEIVAGQEGYPEFVAASDSTTGPQAVLGGGETCFKNSTPFGAPMRVRMRATGGSGMALAQIYSR